MSRKCLRCRRVIGVLGIASVSLVLLHGLVWLWSANSLNALVEQKAGRLRDHGWHIAFGPVRYAGWPNRASVELGPASIAVMGLHLQAETLIAETALLRPGQLTLRSRGHGFHLDADPQQRVLPGELVTQVLDDGMIVTGTNVRIPQLLEAKTLTVQVGPTGVIILAQHLRLFDGHGALGPPIDAFELRAEPTDLLPLDDTLKSAAMAWQAAGNSLDLTLARLVMAGATATGRARLRLDDALQPRAEGILHVVGYAAGLDRLAATGFVSATTAMAVKAVLNLLAAPLPEGSADVSIRIDGHVLMAAGFALLRLPILEWPGPGSLPPLLPAVDGVTPTTRPAPTTR